jgi:hypothetical protein
MRIIGDGIYDISLGQKKIFELQKDFVNKWEESLNLKKKVKDADQDTAYENLWDSWTKENAQKEAAWNKKIRNNRITQAAIGVFSVAFLVIIMLTLLITLVYVPIISMFVFPIYGLSISLFPLAIAAIIIVYTKNRSLIGRGPEMTVLPERALSWFSPSSWMDLESEWWSEVAISRRGIPRTHGSEGEDLLLNSLLLNAPSDQHYYIPNLLLAENLDADGVLVGPTGIWILESKYISGKIRFKDGIWTREKSYFEPGGIQKTKYDEFGDIEKQWDREEKIVRDIVDRHFPHISSHDGLYIQGGVVFTHPKCDIKFESTGKVEFGDIDTWVEDINYGGWSWTVRNPSRLLPDQVLEIVDALLKHSRSIDPKKTMSAVNIALSVNEYQEEIVTDLIDMHNFSPGSAKNDGSIRTDKNHKDDPVLNQQVQDVIYELLENG